MSPKDLEKMPTEPEPTEPEVAIEGAIAPPFFVVTHADGQQSIIPVDFGCTMQIIDPFGAIKATVGLAGVDGIALEL